ncbi:MAG: Ig-like domain-containing protein [Gammaproteobacteria bacterium]
MHKTVRKIIALLMMAALAGCGGGSDAFTGSTSSTTTTPTTGTGTTGTGTTTPVTPSAPVASLQFLVSSPQLLSAGSQDVTLTVLTKDASNNFVSGAPVAFAASSGGIQVTQGTTDASGAATAKLSLGGDPTNRTITVTATTGTLVATNKVSVTGTAITFNGSKSVVMGKTAKWSIFLKDSAGKGIPNAPVTVTSAKGNTLALSSTVTDILNNPVTDANGAVTLNITAVAAGADTITATAAGTSGQSTLTVDSSSFAFTSPVSATEVPLSTAQSVTVRWLVGGTPQVGQTIGFSASRGTLSSTTAVTDGSGDAAVSISALSAGPAVISATTPGGSASTDLTIEFVATTVTSMTVQADPAVISTNGDTSTITATLRDVNNNLIKNKTVRFSVFDVSGGNISPNEAVTDSSGRASTTYTSSMVSSAKDGVVITATVDGTSVSNSAKLTVGSKSLSIALGTGNKVAVEDATRYRLPYSVLVTDSAGSPVKNASVTLSLVPYEYYKGVNVRVYSGSGTFVGWQASVSSLPCVNEDLNLNGIFDKAPASSTPDFDENNNGRLEPGNVATVTPRSVTTDANGFALFDIIYAAEYSQWVTLSLEARASVSGSEALTRARLTLPRLADDFNQQTVSPPGYVSPFGTAATCAINEMP